MTRFILRLAINAIALYLAVLILPGIELRDSYVSIIWLALIFGLVNALFGPLLKFLTCGLILVTLGLFTLADGKGGPASAAAAGDADHGGALPLRHQRVPVLPDRVDRTIVQYRFTHQ